MNLLQAICQCWADATALSGLLPPGRVYTGMSVDPSRPFAVLSKQSQRPVARYNNGAALDAVGLRIQIFHDDHDAAAAIVEQIKAAFDRSQFALSGSDKVVDAQCVNDWEVQQDDGVWQMVVDLNCTVYLAPGA